MNHALAQVEGWLDQSWGGIADLVPRHVNQQRLKRIILNQVRTNPELHKCTPKSVFDACLKAANLGLEVGVMNSAYLVRYGSQCTLVPGFAGLIDLARRSGSVKAINVYIVRKNDNVVMNGDGEIEARIDPFNPDRGERVGAVCVVTMSDGSKQYTTMTTEEYENVRPSHWAKTPHATHPEEMHKKSAIRRAMKNIPLTPEVSDVVASADQAEFQDAEVEIKSTGNAAMHELLDQTEEPEAEEPEDPPGKPEPELEPEPKAPPTRRPYKNWGYDLARCAGLIQKMGMAEVFPIWQRINDGRKAMIERRMKAEQIEDHTQFWDVAESVLVPFDADKIEHWSVKAIDAFLRVPQRGNPDHWQLAAEGAYRPDKTGGEEPADEPFDPLA